MGVKHLNKFLKENAADSINVIHLADLEGKAIAIDTSIYLYKYVLSGNLIGNMFILLRLFQRYNVIPVFIFDGKPPEEKKEVLQKRKEARWQAFDKCKELESYLEEQGASILYEEEQEIRKKMALLKKRQVTISKKDVDDVKELIRAFGATYFDAIGEADAVCAMLSVSGKVWGCLSEDMDMFTYGCPHVLRLLDTNEETVTHYHVSSIVRQLGMSTEDLKVICTLAGTDYNVKESNRRTLKETLRLFSCYQQQQTSTLDFFSWLVANTRYVEEKDRINFDLVLSMFQLEKASEEVSRFLGVNIEWGVFRVVEVIRILKGAAFVLPPKYHKVLLGFDLECAC